MTAHLRYLRYVLLHKLYVARAVFLIVAVRRQHWLRLAWRSLMHDWSKFRPSEWRPYVANFYGEPAALVARRIWELGLKRGEADTPTLSAAEAQIKRERRAAFNGAWLKHLHRNDHHWQHWLLKEDSGVLILMLPPAYVVDEMVADWIGAGTKVLKHPSLAECVTETIVWYMANRHLMQLRTQARERIEETLWLLAAHYALHESAAEVLRAKQSRVTVMVPIPLPNHDRA